MSDAHKDVFEMHIPSSYASMERVADLLEEAAKRSGISEKVKPDFVVAVTEGVVNAIRQGNREDEAKQIHIEIETKPAEIIARIRDEGKGFDVEAVPDPRDPQNRMNPAGRGILMMRVFMDRVEFFRLETGMLVEMAKRITG